jgi:hypothetical protein
MLGKTAMGVRIVNITKPDVVVGIARVVKEEQPPETPVETATETVAETPTETPSEE